MNDAGCTPQKESPIESAKSRLRNLVGETKEIMNGFETKLSSVITQPEITQPKTSPTSGKAETAPQTPLEEFLVAMINDVTDINNYLLSVQNRIQL